LPKPIGSFGGDYYQYRDICSPRFDSLVRKCKQRNFRKAFSNRASLVTDWITEVFNNMRNESSSDVSIDLTESFPHLEKAPIVEAAIDIRARAETPWSETTVKAQIEQKVADYSYLDSQQVFRHQLTLNAGKPLEQTVENVGWKGLRIQSSDHLHIAQFNRDGFVFSRLRPYASWVQLEEEALKIWATYEDLARPTQVQRLGLRFINRFDLPPNDLAFEDYLQPAPTPPKNFDVPFHGFMHHDSLAVPGNPYIVNVVRTIQALPEQSVALILDIDAFTVAPFELNREELVRRLLQMRWLKNKVFFGSITEKALNMFK
jgi:uncharacterized protein (TIGR04255 family)